MRSDGEAVTETLESPASNPKTSGKSPDRPIVLYDGECGLCLSSIAFILRHERGATLLFSPLQSAAARMMLGKAEHDPLPLHSIFLIERTTVLEKSDAALRIASYLRAPWSWSRILRGAPKRIRDHAYDWIARRRYQWFGCATPKAKRHLEAHAGRILQ